MKQILQNHYILWDNNFHRFHKSIETVNSNVNKNNVQVNDIFESMEFYT